MLLLLFFKKFNKLIILQKLKTQMIYANEQRTLCW